MNRAWLRGIDRLLQSDTEWNGNIVLHVQHGSITKVDRKRIYTLLDLSEETEG